MDKSTALAVGVALALLFLPSGALRVPLLAVFCGVWIAWSIKVPGKLSFWIRCVVGVGAAASLVVIGRIAEYLGS